MERAPVTGPLLALVGFVSYGALGLLTAFVGVDWVQGLRYVVVGGAGTVFLYLGLKAVHLTEMANRVWKRSAEYGLILAERRGSPLTRRQRRRGVYSSSSTKMTVLIPCDAKQSGHGTRMTNSSE